MKARKYASPDPYMPKTKELWIALKTEYQWLVLLKDNGKNYEQLIEMIQENGLQDPEDYAPSPTIKLVAERVNQKPALIAKWLRLLYDDLWELNETQPDKFGAGCSNFKLRFSKPGYRNTVYFSMPLERVLLKGETFRWYFIQAKMGENHFYVDHIYNDFLQGKHVTTIDLKAGYYNAYSEQLLEKGLFLRLINQLEIFGLTDYQVDQLLVHRVVKERSGYPEELKHLESNKNYF
ncbi:hypothetical protein [Mucilaginibacter jinjuensis]|uniref:Uncharacterized protein n=1 Tax=Mucilaginibacter jinjuensis TaxID=1176721 RepID=A0ABY7TCZ6_9SPHI|nr:hypothetical protein [Mucilaginibacter jinjuensis]WCT13497.1 hypothetical protein PQO05_06055 [Mucilaginibacter jinjuensis]